MSVWQKYTKKQQDEYIKFLTVYGALSNLFRQKQGEPIPYLDSKFQETIYAKVFKSENVDIGNTPHDILSVFGSERIGIGLKTWMHSNPSYQKVMQLKRYQDEIMSYKNNLADLVYTVSKTKNKRMVSDYNRLGLSKSSNIYHYITRDAGKLVIQECAYPLIELDNIKDIKDNKTSVSWSDGIKKYKFTYGDCQIWQCFSLEEPDTTVIGEIKVDIIQDPFTFLINAYDQFKSKPNNVCEEIARALDPEHIAPTASFISKDTIYEEAYLPLYSYKHKEVELKSGLNAWNAAPKSRGSTKLRPLNEVYIPIPREFHKRYPHFFINNIFEFEEAQSRYQGAKEDKPEIRFKLVLPNGKIIPALITQERHKAFQSGSRSEIDPLTGKPYGQSALGQWLLVDVLGLDERIPVTRDWLIKKDVDSVRVWHEKGDYNTYYIDIAPVNSFERFMDDLDQIDVENTNI